MNHASIWQQTKLPEHPSLTGNLHTEAAVIGGGMAGLLTAWALQQRGIRAIVLEASRIASGQTGRTTAKLTSQHGLIYARLTDQLGRSGAAQYARANEEALSAFARLIRDKHIDCGFTPCDACLYSTNGTDELLRETDAARSLGLDAAFVLDTELPFPVSGAVRFRNQARFHPLKFLRAITGSLTIYEHTRVLSVDGLRIHTDHGDVTAEHVIFACHYPFVNVPGLYFMRMHQERSCVLALQNPWKPHHIYLGADADGLSLREAEGLLLLGGSGYRTGENESGGRYNLLRRQASALLPGCREVACWSAQDCITLDGVPYIGQYSPRAPGWYVATGFAKWGMTSSMASAILLSGMICGQPPEWAAVFSPQRFKLSASARSLADETGHALRGLSREVFSLPRETMDALPPGHGGIVELDGHKLGVYREPEGCCHIVDPRCPHLGCQLTWNPDERTWDCPCHGSRFRYDGSVLDGPAQSSLL
ncbi:MAG: FAD-dependent oxidoreductase [Clostridia bacterium]|nr:FAD-dependent oxidoreductase [Clostridia bacterium]